MKNLILSFLGLVGSFAAFSQADEYDRMPYVLGDMLIMIDDNENIKNVINAYSTVNGFKTGLKENKLVSKPTNIWLLNFNNNVISHVDMMAALAASEHVLLIQNNHKVTQRLAPNDTDYSTQWHHDDGATDNDIDSELAWNITTGGQTSNGDDIVVCVLEGGGSDWSHPDLVDNHWTNTLEIPNNNIDDDNNGYIDDVNGWNVGNSNDVIGAGGHGTSVSGMIGAKGNNNSQVVGANWDVKIMQVDMPFGLSEANVIDSYTYPLVMRQLYTATNGDSGAFVVATNASWGIDGGDPANAPLWCAFYDSLGNHGILNFGATANNNVNIDVVGDLPTGCGSDYMISVTATNNADVRTFSGYGQTTIDLGAPGESVVTTANGGGITSTSGTSFATPLTAGVCGLIYSVPCSNLADLSMQDPQGAADIVRGAILNGVDPVANLATETVTGGRLNAFNSCDIIQNDCATYGCSGTFEATPVDVANCIGDCTGEITMSGSGGSGNYTYDIGNGPQADSVFTGLCAGTYTVNVDDGVSCNVDIEVTIAEPTGVTFSSTSENEVFGDDGSIDLTVSGGTPPYTYAWTGPGGFTSTEEDPDELEGGFYTVTVTDANGCTFMSEEIEVISVLGIGQNQLTFSIYPNPADDLITVTLSNEELVDFVLFDNTGRVVQQQQLNQLTNAIDLSTLSKGVYVITLTTQSGTSTTKKMVIK